MKKYVAIMLLMVLIMTGCGKEEKTYEEGLSEGFNAGYDKGLWDYDGVAAQSGKVVVYADKYGYLTGYHDGIVGNYRAPEFDEELKRLHEAYVVGYEQGYKDATEGVDSIDNFGGVLSWHNVTTEE